MDVNIYKHKKNTLMNTLTKETEIACSIIHSALQQKHHQLLEPEAIKLIETFGIASTRHKIVFSVSGAVRAAEFIGYPVVLKVVSPNISHKTDVGGVKLGIRDGESVKIAYEEIIKNTKKVQPDAEIHGILVAEMAPPSLEVIVGGLRDPQFGPVVMFGLGGIFVEILKDVSFRIAPVEEHEVFDMIQDIKGAKILQGFRGKEALDVHSLVQTIMHVSDIMISVEQIREVDLNPILVYPKGIKTLDARIVLEQSE